VQALVAVVRAPAVQARVAAVRDRAAGVPGQAGLVVVAAPAVSRAVQATDRWMWLAFRRESCSWFHPAHSSPRSLDPLAQAILDCSCAPTNSPVSLRAGCVARGWGHATLASFATGLSAAIVLALEIHDSATARRIPGRALPCIARSERLALPAISASSCNVSRGRRRVG
jgi:hypothetical protein